VSTAPTATADDRTVGPSGSPWRQVRLCAGAHAVDDVYQGLLLAAMPYFALQRHFSYVEAAGLVPVATLGSESGSGLDRRWLVDAERPTKHPRMENTMTGVHE
jgi:hypothetical protein